MLFFKGLNFEEDWKLLTILMGMNDICDYCKDKVCPFLSLNAEFTSIKKNIAH